MARRPRRLWSSPWFHLGLLVLTAATAAFAGGASYAFWLLLILGSHEMGHYLACRAYGIPASLPYFIPGLPFLSLFGTFGAVIRIRGIIPHRKALFDVAAAGPLAGFVVALPVLVAGVLRATPVDGGFSSGDLQLGSPLVSAVLEKILHPQAQDLRVDSLYLAGWVGMLMTSLNLFPVGQLDGGHGAYAVSRRLHRFLARTTLLALAALVVYQSVVLVELPAYALWLVVLLFMRSRHPRLADESAPLGGARRIVAVLLLLIFLATFIPIPLRFF